MSSGTEAETVIRVISFGFLQATSLRLFRQLVLALEVDAALDKRQHLKIGCMHISSSLFLSEKEQLAEAGLLVSLVLNCSLSEKQRFCHAKLEILTAFPKTIVTLRF